MIEAPVLHVNGDDPEAVVLATQLALDYRQGIQQGRGGGHCLLPQTGSQRAGHPSMTQPLMYKKIGQHPGTRKVYGDKLIGGGTLAATGP